LKNELVGFFGTVAAIVIFLSLRYFYKQRFEENMLEGKQKIIGVVVIIISVLIAVFLMF